MNIPQQSGTLAYVKPGVRDRGTLEHITKSDTGEGRTENAAWLLIWADPFRPSDDPLPIGSQEAR